jgi:hypothetical protein
MNSINQQLEHLLSSAARAPGSLPEKAPFAVEARVLARWRGRPDGAGEGTHLLLPLLRRAVLCSCLLMLLSIAVGYRTLINAESDEVSLANSAVDFTLLP